MIDLGRVRLANRSLLILSMIVAFTMPNQLLAHGLERAQPLADIPSGLEVERVHFKEMDALRLRDAAGLVAANRMVRLAIDDFRNGTIEGQFAGAPLANASPTARGFVGIAFRVQPDSSRYEAIYVRLTNGRSQDQRLRNRAVQYVSEPAYPWERLRAEAPGQYESYGDVAVNEWIPFKIEVDGTEARLFLRGAAQPTLIVSDLKLGNIAGDVALWVGPETEGYFTDISVKSLPD